MASKHKGTYVSAFLEQEIYEKVLLVEKWFDGLGSKGRNRSRAISYMIQNFDTSTLNTGPKLQALPPKSKAANVALN